jgi:hypothetical protein
MRLGRLVSWLIETIYDRFANNTYLVGSFGMLLCWTRRTFILLRLGILHR